MAASDTSGSHVEEWSYNFLNLYLFVNLSKLKFVYKQPKLLIHFL